MPRSPEAGSQATRQPRGAEPSPSPAAGPVTAADLAARPGLVHALQTARAWGASPSVFFGEVKRSRTERIYTDAGRVVEEWTEHEPDWSEDDRELALALADYEATLCDGHGGPLEQGMDPANEFAFRGRMKGRCHACTALAVAASQAEGAPHPSALKFTVEYDEEAAAAGRERVARAEAERGRTGGVDGAGAAGAAE